MFYDATLHWIRGMLNHSSLFMNINDVTYKYLISFAYQVDADTIWNEAHSANAARMVSFVDVRFHFLQIVKSSFFPSTR